MRTRLIYSKRGGACFVPHVALSAIFSRAASRAGLNLEKTQGFSPRARISFAPELPAGVIALNEPVEIFFANNVGKEIPDLLNASMPEGFYIKNIMFPDEKSVSLGKVCTHAIYSIRSRFSDVNKLDSLLHEFYVSGILKTFIDNEWVKILMKEPAQNGIGFFVKNMISKGIMNNWAEINVVREQIGRWNGKEINLE